MADNIEVNDAEDVSVDTAIESLNGAFIDSLLRNNAEIRKDRALAIQESAEMLYKRKVEDIEARIKLLKRDRASMLDLSPTNKQSLMVASDFKAEDFVAKDISLGVEIRNEMIILEIAKARYNELFVKSSKSKTR